MEVSLGKIKLTSELARNLLLPEGCDQSTITSCETFLVTRITQGQRQ